MRVLVVLALPIMFAGMAYGQGSTYGPIGFGLPVRSGSATIDALGGTGLALRGSRFINDQNPADWTWLTEARFGAAIKYDYISATQGTGQDVQQGVKFTSLAFGAPIWRAIGASFALGYEPLTDASNQIDETDSLLGTRQYLIKGGANVLFGGVAAQPLTGLALGARFDYLTGNIRHLAQVSFVDTAAGSGEFERDYLFHGVRGTFGIELIGDSIASALRGLTIGATYSLATNLTSTNETIITPTSSSLDTTIDTAGVGHYPAAFAAGISYNLSRRYRAEADYFSQNFSTAYVYSPTPISGDPLLNTSNRISVAVERLANVTGEFGTSFGIDRWALRLGFSYATLPEYPVGSGGVHEFALSAGTGIPVSLATMLNLSIVAGQRLPAVTGMAPKENFVRIGADVSFSETWFVPTPR